MIKAVGVILAALLIMPRLCAGAGFRQIIIADSAHPAIRSAAQIIADRLQVPPTAIVTVPKPGVPDAGQIVLIIAGSASAEQKQLLGSKIDSIRADGYVLAFSRSGGLLICGARPRSLLFAAGDWWKWKEMNSGTLVREPSFALRTAEYDAHFTVAQYVAELGVNTIIRRANPAAATLKDTFPEVYEKLSDADQQQLTRARAQQVSVSREFTRECHDADVDFYTFLYGNDFSSWSRILYEAAIKAYPSIKGTDQPGSFEKATLCPSDPLTWKLVKALIADVMDQSDADGLYATFWDRYGINCQDDRCRQDGLNTFPNQLYECIKAYHEALAPAGKKLIVRTWSSGVPHWLGDQFVHAPGYDHFGGAGVDLWSRVIKELPADIALQNKVYDSDCQPDSRVSPLLGQVKPHPEIVEYQLSGQTTGRFYFPTSSVDYDSATMRKARELVGPTGGVNVFPGGTMQSGNYSLANDILNGINLYAWRETAWNVDADLDRVWMEWAVPLYGPKAAPHVIKALRLSEEAVNRSFSALGMGADTNSGFAGSIARRETLLMYTNRYFLPDYARFLEPSRENIQRVIDEKLEAQKKIELMMHELDLARPDLTREQADELTTRFNWLREFNLVARHLDESLWRYRYLRYKATMLTTDPEQMLHLAESYDFVKEHQPKLFQFDPNQKFSCYSVPLGQLQRPPGLGNPMPLMQELYKQSKSLVEGVVGPQYLPREVIRDAP